MIKEAEKKTVVTTNTEWTDVDTVIMYLSCHVTSCQTSNMGLMRMTFIVSPEPQDFWFSQIKSVGGFFSPPASEAQICKGTYSLFTKAADTALKSNKYVIHA